MSSAGLIRLTPADREGRQPSPKPGEARPGQKARCSPSADDRHCPDARSETERSGADRRAAVRRLLRRRARFESHQRRTAGTPQAVCRWRSESSTSAMKKITGRWQGNPQTRWGWAYLHVSTAEFRKKRVTRQDLIFLKPAGRRRLLRSWRLFVGLIKAESFDSDVPCCY